MPHLSAVDHRIESPQVKAGYQEESHNQTDLSFTVFNKPDRHYCVPLPPCFNVGPCEKPSDQFVIRRGHQFTLVLQNRPARGYKALPVFPLHFLDLDKKIQALVENLQAIDIAWDPTRRYVATSVTISDQISQRRNRGIDGFKMWSSTGEFLYWFPSTDYCLLQLSWRPYGGNIQAEMLVDEDSEDDDFFWPSEAESQEEESEGAEESEEES